MASENVLAKVIETAHVHIKCCLLQYKLNNLWLTSWRKYWSENITLDYRPVKVIMQHFCHVPKIKGILTIFEGTDQYIKIKRGRIYIYSIPKMTNARFMLGLHHTLIVVEFGWKLSNLHCLIFELGHLNMILTDLLTSSYIWDHLVVVFVPGSLYLFLWPEYELLYLIKI